MSKQWREDTPIYIQLKDEVIDLILNGTYAEGTSLPSVRNISAEFNINHLTVAKSYQILVEQGLVEKRRGMGMFVKAGAHQQLLQQQQQLFFEQELPQFITRLNQLGIDSQTICDAIDYHTAQSLQDKGSDHE